MKKNVYRIVAFILTISILCAVTGCNRDKGADKLPAVLFLRRTDYSDLYSPGEIEKDVTVISSLAFYDKDGNYYFSDDPDINALNNKTLASEYEAGNLSEKLKSGKSIDSGVLSEQYTELRKICLNEKIEMDLPENLPSVQSEITLWYAFYYDENGEMQYQTIHTNKCMTDIYAKNDKINDIYEQIAKN